MHGPRAGAQVLAEPPLPPRTKWTRRVPHPVLIGRTASLSQVVTVEEESDGWLRLSAPQAGWVALHGARGPHLIRMGKTLSGG